MHLGLETLSAGYAAVYDFVRFVSDLQQQGTKVLITLAPSESQVDLTLRAQLAKRYLLDLTSYDWSLPGKVIQAISSQVDARIPIVDLTGYFQCRAEAGEKLYHPGNTHWNLEGNALAGQVIASWMLQNWFSAAATLPRDLQSCVAEKDAAEPKTSPAAIQAFIGETLQPTIHRSAEHREGQH